MAEPMAQLARSRDSILEHAAALDWPEIIVEEIGRVADAPGWTAAVELATVNELIALSRALVDAVAGPDAFDDEVP